MASIASLKRSRSPSQSRPPSLPDENTSAAPVPDSPHKSKKLKLHSSHTLTSPFPNFPHPTPSEAQEVHDLLSSHHHDQLPPKDPAESNNSANTCGSVPNVIDSLIGTILSQNTSSKNSSSAKKRLDDTFGLNNFAAIADASRANVVEAIKQGGLANKKAATIQNLLSSIHAKHNTYSLQHLTSSSFSDAEIMQELISYDGVGPKTASCVLLFCLGRDSFAVDTHVFRLSKVLGWVPERADRVTAQGHLDLRIPGELKYGLHVMMVGHGRVCKGCKKNGKGKCVLKEWVKDRREVTEETSRLTKDEEVVGVKEDVQ